MAAAVIPGWRTYGLVIPGPTRMFSVAVAIEVSVTKTSLVCSPSS